MIYITIKQHQKPYQLNFEDVILDKVPVNLMNRDSNIGGTITRRYEQAPAFALEQINVPEMISRLQKYNEKYHDLMEKDRASLYRSFSIPKKTGGWRKIKDPCPELRQALSELLYILRDEFGVLYHTSAMAYIPKRSITTAVNRHVSFGSNWYLKTDLEDFFGSTTLNYMMHILSMVFPLSEIIRDPEGEKALRRALSIGILDGGLPQGSILSPALTNMVMIPIDHALFNEFASRAMIYTRYSDDMHVSAKENFPYKAMLKIIRDTFRKFGAPYVLKDEKTHYGSVNGKNWILGLMANGQHQITVGHVKKKYFKAMLCNFILDTKNGKPWSVSDVQSLNGTMSYYKMIEKQYFMELVNRANRKWGVDVESMIKSYIRVG